MIQPAQRIVTWLAAGAVSVLAAGCTVGPNYHPPATTIPSGWVGTATTRPTTQGSLPVEQQVELARWWTVFHDPQLESLIDRAIQDNLDLRQAEVRVRQARAQRRVVAAGLWPTVDTNGSYRRAGSTDSSATDLFRAGLDAAWELDIFGGNRRSVEAAEAEIQSTIEDQRDVLVTLVSEVALTYLDLRGFQREIEIANANLEDQRRSFDLTKRRQQGGFVSGLDVANAQSLVAGTEAGIPLLESNERQTIYALAFLLGEEPAALIEELSKPGQIPRVPENIPVGLPSDLLRRRPDIRRADANVHAATARIGVATADLFPRFNLAGSLAYQSNNVNSLFDSAAGTWSIGPSVSWPLFSAGSIRANIAVQNAAHEQALLAYRSTVLGALRDVEVALVAYVKEQQHRALLQESEIANRRAVDLSTQLYTQGQTDFLNVLAAQRALLNSQDALVQSDRILAQELIALYKALGGGWQLESPATQPAP